MTANKDFALLVGKAFLRELEAGNTDGAIAFGRAFLLALGHKGPEGSRSDAAVNGKERSQAFAQAET
ncbi:MAG: hypothetical protein JSU93_00760 [Methanobacteriota archaeon]|nr:MAG: hypothetical protein JSU93_00760 [Euryarchaeota archaeon]